MAQEWFVIRDGKETGPFALATLKDRVAKGFLDTDTLIRHVSAKTPVKAGTVQELFPPTKAEAKAKAATPTPASRPKPPPSPPRSGPPRPASARPAPPDSPSFSQPKSSNPSKRTVIILSAVGGVFLFLCCGGAAVFGLRMQGKAEKQLAEADALWNKGDKAGAVERYRKLIDDENVVLLKDENRPKVFGRVIDHEYERGDAAAGKALIEKADKSGIVPAVSHPAAKEAVAATPTEARKRQERQSKQTPQEQLKGAKWDDFVPAGALYNEFNGNEVAANEKYKGKVILVEGEVESVESGGALSSNRIYLSYRRGLRGVRCAVSGGNDDELKKVQPGSWVRVRGECGGKMFSGTVEMSDCAFVLVNR